MCGPSDGSVSTLVLERWNASLKAGGPVTSLLRFAQGVSCGPLTAGACQVECMSVTRWCRSTILPVPVSVSTTRARNLLLVDVALEARQVRCVESIDSYTIPL